MSLAQSFLVVSTGCLTTFENNSRTKFTNNLAKPAKASKPWVNSLYLDVEQVNFEYTPVYYENHEPDFLYAEVMGETSYKIPRCYTVDDLTLYLRHPAISGYIHSYSFDGVKITLRPWHDVLIHEKFANFLNIADQLRKSTTHRYYHLDRMREYTSSRSVILNKSEINYVDLICEEITPYFCDGENKKIIARIDVMNKKDQTIHLDTLIRRFYKINSTSLETLSFELKQPNGAKLLMREGPPTIIKARLKEMETNTDFFYIQVNSQETASFPKNNASSFTAELPNELELKGEWEVAITHAELPTTEGMFREEIRLYPVKNTAEIHLVVINGHHSEKKWEKYSIAYPPTSILTMETFLETLMNMAHNLFEIYIDEDGAPKIFAKNPKQKIYLVLAPLQFGECMFPSLENTGMTKEYIDALATYIKDDQSTPKNEPFKEIYERLAVYGWENVKEAYEIRPYHVMKDKITSKFLFEFKEYYKNEATLKKNESLTKTNTNTTMETFSRKTLEEEKKLLEILEKRTGIVYTSKTIPTWIFLYADFVKPTLIADCYSNVLKLIPYKQNAELNGRFYTFTPLDFFTVNKDALKTLTFELRTHAGEKHDFRNKNKVTSLTLYFRRMK